MSPSRQAAKARRRTELLSAAGRRFAADGFHATTLTSIATAAGVSAPAVYRHFASKAELLSALLVDVSEQLLAGGRAASQEADPLAALCLHHARFAVTQPDTIRVQERDLTSLDPPSRHRVRRLQAEYVRLWIDALAPLLPGTDAAELSVRVHAAFGLLNSTPHGLRRSGPVPDAVGLLASLAHAALTAER